MERFSESELIEISIAIGGSILLGWLIKRFLLPVFFKISKRTKWEGDDLLVESISKWVITWFLLAALIYVLPVFSGHFPYIKRKESLIQHIIGVLYIFSLTWVAARVVGGLLHIRSHRENGVIVSSSILANIVRGIIYCIGFILILQTFGVAIAPLLAALGVGGIAVALALQPTLSNLFSGLQLIASGKINIGDFIQLEGGQRGFIRDITWRNTTIETGQNNIVVVPNSKLADSVVENFFLDDKKLSVTLPLRVGYETDLAKAEQVIIQVTAQVLENVAGGVKEIKPIVRYSAFGESGIDVKVSFSVREYANQFLIVSELIKAIHKKFREEGIDIPYPVRTVIMNKWKI